LIVLDTALVAVFPDAADAVKEVVKSEDLQVQTLTGVSLDGLRVTGTPTLLLVDNGGTVLSTWIGVLPPKQELEVMKVLAGHSGGSREPA
jgi:thioredoxin-related protein